MEIVTIFPFDPQLPWLRFLIFEIWIILNLLNVLRICPDAACPIGAIVQLRNERPIPMKECKSSDPLFFVVSVNG